MTVYVRNAGVVTPAGWGMNSMRDALAKGEPLPIRPLARPGWTKSLRVRVVPACVPRPAFLGHPRVRRASPISHYAIAAALEALGSDLGRVQSGSIRLGIVLCVTAGCVNYSRRFYDETTRDPATASPLLFSETVFNAPASHLASIVGGGALSYTLVGDAGMFLTGLAIAADWLTRQRIDAALVISGEEMDWLVADAARRFHRRIAVSEGAGALYLAGTPEPGTAVQLAAITDSHSFLQHQSRAQAVNRMRDQLPEGTDADLLCDSLIGITKVDSPELGAWANWKGSRISPKLFLGEGLAASSAWQCAAAVDAIRQNRAQNALVSVVGAGQQTIGAVFTKTLP